MSSNLYVRGINLPIEYARFLDQERVRLQEKTGEAFSPSEIVQLLVMQHQTRMQLRAESDPGSVAWMYRVTTGAAE